MLGTFETQFAHTIYKTRYSKDGQEEWPDTARRVVLSVMEALPPGGITQRADTIYGIYDRVAARQAMPGGRYLYAAGRDYHQVNNCVLLRCPDSREGWASTSYKAEMSLCSGAGIGVWYGDVRGQGELIKRTGGTASGPLPKMMQVNDTGRHVMQGGNRRSAIWAGLPWWHSDIFDFIMCKDWPDEIKALKEKDPTFPAPMDFTNISVTLDDAFFTAYGDPSDPRHEHAHAVYQTAVAHMLKHGEPGFSIDTGTHAGEVLRNACTEITSADDSDVCNLGSLVLPRFDSPRDFGRAVREMTLFLIAGTCYSDVPYEQVAVVREANRRLGLGLIGVHEFLMQQGVKYGTDEAFEVLEPYMIEYARATEYAWDWEDKLNLSHSKGTRAIAPNGTIGIVAESSASADPILAAAEIRAVKKASPKGDILERHIVVDPVAKRLREAGVSASLIEDAHTLALEPERRLAQQAYLQRYVDHAISSTVNLDAPVTDEHEVRAFGETMMRYLPELRGVTVYPNGARAGQPRTPCDLDWALANEGEAFTDDATCGGGVCGD